MRLLMRTFGAALVLTLGAHARADMINGSAAGSDSATINTSTIATATSATFSAIGGYVTGTTGTYNTYLAPSGRSTAYPIESSITFATSSTSSFTAAFYNASGTYVGTFAAASQVLLDQNSNVTGGGQADLYLLGTFTPAGAFASAGYVPAATSFTMSFTQSSTGASVGYSYSMSTPPAPLTVPVPPSIVMGMTSIVGIGVIGRVRRRLS